MVGRSGIPRPVRAILASAVKRSVTKTTEGIPRLVNSMQSWTLHDVHEPQLARPTTAKSPSRAASAITASSTAVLTGTSNWITSLTP